MSHNSFIMYNKQISKESSIYPLQVNVVLSSTMKSRTHRKSHTPVVQALLTIGMLIQGMESCNMCSFLSSFSHAGLIWRFTHFLGCITSFSLSLSGTPLYSYFTICVSTYLLQILRIFQIGATLSKFAKDIHLQVFCRVNTQE